METKKSIQVNQVNFDDYQDARNSGVVLVSPETVGSRNIWMGVGFLAPEEVMSTGVHRSEEALYVIQGSGILSSDDQEIHLKAGTAVYIPANVNHSLSNTGKVRMIFVTSMTKTSSEDSEAQRGELCLNCE